MGCTARTAPGVLLLHGKRLYISPAAGSRGSQPAHPRAPVDVLSIVMVHVIDDMGTSPSQPYIPCWPLHMCQVYRGKAENPTEKQGTATWLNGA